MSFRPLIGLTTRLEIETNRFYLGRDYSEAVNAVGGTPLHIGLIPDKTYIRETVKRLDGVLLPGSDTDVDPLRFGTEPHPNLKKVIWEKEETDLLVLKEAEKQGIPVLGICFGMQILNVYRGGTLIQDIEAEVEDPVKHEQGIPLARNSHSIDILSGSRLGNIAGAKQTRVNSHHHQAVGQLGKNLVSTAWAKDGVVECIEDKRADKFVLGVQWHPELSWGSDDLSWNIFQEFIDQAIRVRKLKK